MIELELRDSEVAGPSPAGGDDAGAHQRGARADRLRLLYRQSVHGSSLSLVGAALWVALMWPVADRRALVAWIVVKLFAIAGRFGLFAAYRRIRPEGDAILHWERPFVITLMPPVLVWGIGCVLVTPAEPLLYRAITFMMLIGMAGVGIAFYLLLERLTQVVLILLIAPMVTALVLDGRQTSLLLAACGASYLFAALRAVQVHSRTVDESFRLGRALADATRLADLRAVTDPLTGLLNRRGFLETAERTLRAARQEGRPSAALLIDLDDLKAINDGWGHAAGDAALAHLAAVVRARVRNSDVCGRIGGDELAVLLAEASPDDSRRVAEGIRRAVAERPVAFAGQELTLTVSVGLAADVEAIDELLADADTALYAAKREGKNRFVALDAVWPQDRGRESTAT